MKASTAVEMYVDHCRRFGYEPLHSDKARVGKAAKELLANNKSDELIIDAVERAAERNQPGLVLRIAGDIERGAIGPGINPIDSRILGFHLPILQAQQRPPQLDLVAAHTLTFDFGDQQ